MLALLHKIEIAESALVRFVIRLANVMCRTGYQLSQHLGFE